MSKWSLKNRMKSFGYAFNGLKVFLTEPHLTFHLISAIIVIFAGIILELSPVRWGILLLTIGLVISLELVNTALEKLIDKIHPERDPTIGYVKDILAASVLVASVFSIFIGVALFFF